MCCLMRIRAGGRAATLRQNGREGICRFDPMEIQWIFTPILLEIPHRVHRKSSRLAGLEMEPIGLALEPRRRPQPRSSAGELARTSGSGSASANPFEEPPAWMSQCLRIQRGPRPTVPAELQSELGPAPSDLVCRATHGLSPIRAPTSTRCCATWASPRSSQRVSRFARGQSPRAGRDVIDIAGRFGYLLRLAWHGWHSKMSGPASCELEGPGEDVEGGTCEPRFSILRRTGRSSGCPWLQRRGSDSRGAG